MIGSSARLDLWPWMTTGAGSILGCLGLFESILSHFGRIWVEFGVKSTSPKSMI